MATLDKLVKTVESLRLYQSPAISLDPNLSKKEKMAHCNAVAENICSQANMKTTSEFAKYLTVASEMFFTLINDEDADIKLLADECLTRIVKHLSESATNVGRMQVELYKEIKKNGSSKSLRSALSKFAAICGQIRPQKSRAYIVNLIPCFIKIATTRREEAVHETLADAMGNVFSHLGHYTNDNEVNLLLKTFLNNLSDTSPPIRRSTASILTSICTGSRKPAYFLLWLLSSIMDLVVPVPGEDLDQVPSETLLGVLVGSRATIPLLERLGFTLELDSSLLLQKCIQLYELCICLLNSKNSTVVAHALETLQQVLHTPPFILKQALTSPAGILESRIFQHNQCNEPSASQPPTQGATPLQESDNDEDLEEESKLGECATRAFERGRIKLMDSIDVPIDSDIERSELSESEAGDSLTNGCPSQQPTDKTASGTLNTTPGNVGSFCDKDVPLIYCSRKLVASFLLLPSKGDLIPDSQIRVSTKVLAIGCLTHAIAMAPKVFLLTLYSDKEEEDITTVLIRDIANYTQHEDPQLRGSTVLLMGQVLRGASVESGGDLDLWYNSRRPDHMDTLNILQNLMSDELISALTMKHILSSVSKFLPGLLCSIHARSSINLLKDILAIPHSPTYNYWLVKTELCKLIGVLPFMALYHVVPDIRLQDECITILMSNLGDEDSKVREEAAQAFAVAQFYWPHDGGVQNSNKCSVTSAAIKMSSDLLLPVIGEREADDQAGSRRLIYMLETKLMTSHSPAMTSGLVEVLLRLSTTQKIYLECELMEQCSKILQSRQLVAIDVVAHGKLLKLVSNALESLATRKEKSSEIKELSVISHEILTHCYVVLNLVHHLLDSAAAPLVPTPKPQSTVSQNSITNPSASPIKQIKASTIVQELTDAAANATKDQGRKTTSEEAASTKQQIGYFAHSHHYLKFFDTLKNVYSAQRNSLEANDKFKQFCIDCLDCLSSVLEYAPLDKSVGKSSEELLFYLKTTFGIDSYSSLKCVRALLRCIFGANAASLPNVSNDAITGATIVFSQTTGLFYPCFDQPYNELVHTFHLARDSTSTPDRSESLLFKPSSSSSGSSSRSSRRASKSSVDRATLSNYIRLFEPMVIRALKHYTITSNVDQQSQVLQLLIQLVHLRVNYCLLDSDKIFVTYVLKQLDLIEEGQMHRAFTLIPDMFKFLVLLSYEKYHSKPIIDIPKILQLCEGLFASGQNAELFVMPALIPVAEDLYCVRSVSDQLQQSELDAQREVMLTMLIKLLPYTPVLKLTIKMLRSTKSEGDDRWRKLSRVLAEALIPLMAAQKIHIEEKLQVDLMHQIFASLAPGTLRPVDPLLSAMLTCTVDMAKLRDVQRWLGFVVLALPILTNQSPEEAILARLEELGIQMIASTMSGQDDDGNVVMGASLMSMDSSTSTSSDALTSGSKPEITLAKFLIQAIGAACTKYHHMVYSQLTESTSTFLQQELSHLLLFVTYMFQSGRYYKVAKAAKTLAKHEMDGNKTQMLYTLEFITEMFIQLAHSSPFITLQWCYILKLMNHCPQALWYKVLQPQEHRGNCLESESLNYEILRRGGLVLLCDHLCENISNVEHTTWLIVNFTQSLVCSINESPVQEFVMSVHRTASSSGLLLQAVITRVATVGDNAKVAFLKDALAVVENVHKSLAGKLVGFLVNKYLLGPHLSLTKQANFIACTRVEAMLNSPKEDVFLLFSPDELASILESLKSRKLTKRFGRLSTLLNRVATDFFDLSPITGVDDVRTFNPGSISQVRLDRDWLLGQIRVRCCHPENLTAKANTSNGLVCAKILSTLESEEEILEIMTLNDFSLSVLSSCLVYDSQRKASGLFSASRKILLSHIKTMTETLPLPFGLFRPNSWPMSSSDSRYTEWLESTFNNGDFVRTLSYLLPAVQVAFETKALEEMDEDDCFALTRLVVLVLEFCKWVNCDLTDEKIVMGREETSVQCFKVVALALADHQVSEFLSRDQQRTSLWPTSICLMLNDIIMVRFSIATDQVPICSAFKVASEEGQETATIVACINLNELFTDLLNGRKAQAVMPTCWFDSYKAIIIGLCRLSKFTSYLRNPPELWTLGWSPLVDLDSLSFPSIPIDYLHDHDILVVYAKRLLALGWRSRKQFEESWMALLGVFSLSKEELSDAEVSALAQVSTIAVSAITGLLLQTILLPLPGHPGLSRLIHHPRDYPSSFLATKRGQKLTLIQNLIHEGLKGQNVCYLPVDSVFNTERCNGLHADLSYGFGQLSVHYILSSIKYNSVSSHSELDNKSTKSSAAMPLALIQREDAMSHSGLDTRSCLIFLQELYGQWLTEETPLSLLTETVRSVLVLSDLFSETSQYQWMLDNFQEIQKTHPFEDEMLTNLLRIGICKAVSVLGLADPDLMERLRKSLEVGLKAANLPTRMGCLHGLLYLAQSESPEVTAEVNSHILPFVLDYLQTYLQHASTPHVGQSEAHVALMWSVAFHILENNREDVVDHDEAVAARKKDWGSNMLKLAVSEASKGSSGTSHGVYLVLLIGLERLVIEQVLDEVIFNKVIKLTTDLLTEPNPMVFIPAVQLFLACMYSNKNWTEVAGLGQDPEQLMQAMEQMSILFDCVRRSGVNEAKLLCDILPKVLADFFSAADVMNRVINEFISPGQPHQVLLAGILFAVFQQAAGQDQMVMMQQWVLSSLPNFTKRSPVSHSIWCLTVFFISASANNPYLQAMFPYLQQRFGCYSHEDKRLFCLAARHFYHSLGEDRTSQEHFIQTIKNVAKPRTPYFDLLKSLE